MVYKIEINKFGDFFDEFKNKGNFYINGKNIFLSTNENIDEFGCITDYVIIDASNYKMSGDEGISRWCKNELHEHELNIYEQSNDCQIKLKACNEYMDKIEKELEEEKRCRKKKKKKILKNSIK